MKSTTKFNNISDELKAKIPKLKPGETKTFTMLNGTPNPDPDPREAAKEPMIFGKRQLMTSFRIYDEFQKNKEGKVVGDFVSVGAVERWNGDEPERFLMIVPGMDMGSRFQGKFSLSGGKQTDEELWEILYLSPEREGSPCPDKGIAPIFRLIDFKADSQAKVTRFDRLSKAIELAKSITPQKAKEVLAALNQPEYQDEEVMLSQVKDLARQRPDEFINTFEDPKTQTISLIRDAISADIISHDLVSGVVKMGDVRIAVLKIEGTDSFAKEFTKWIEGAQNGKDVLGNIKKQLDKTKEKVS